MAAPVLGLPPHILKRLKPCATPGCENLTLGVGCKHCRWRSRVGTPIDAVTSKAMGRKGGLAPKTRRWR